jgi:putative acetyltransferase
MSQYAIYTSQTAQRINTKTLYVKDVMSKYPEAVEKSKVGEYPAHTKSGGGYFYDDVLEYRVWCRPWQGAPDEFEGEIYYYAFATFEEALEFSEDTEGSEKPLVLVRQKEWINEPEAGTYIQEKGERITEWLVEWLEDSKRNKNSISEFIETNGIV